MSEFLTVLIRKMRRPCGFDRCTGDESGNEGEYYAEGNADELGYRDTRHYHDGNQCTQ